MYVCVLYIYIYIERERERPIDRGIETLTIMERGKTCRQRERERERERPRERSKYVDRECDEGSKGYRYSGVEQED